jgi:hypothetical protein
MARSSVVLGGIMSVLIPEAVFPATAHRRVFSRGHELGCRLGAGLNIQFDRWMRAFDETGTIEMIADRRATG